MHIPYKTKNASTQHVCNPKQLDNSPIKKKKSTVYSTYMLTIIFERESGQKGKNTTEILVFGDLWGRGGKGSSL